MWSEPADPPPPRSTGESAGRPRDGRSHGRGAAVASLPVRRFPPIASATIVLAWMQPSLAPRPR
jgi:hypothetical protein